LVGVKKSFRNSLEPFKSVVAGVENEILSDPADNTAPKTLPRLANCSPTQYYRFSLATRPYEADNKVNIRI
jgi:hypothetical protein